MSTSIQATLARRVLSENRKPLIWLAGGLVINVLIYAFGIYPLSQRVANVEQRNSDAARSLADARRENSLAAGTLSGKDRALSELQTFYTSVLPADLAGARRLTHVRLAQLARLHALSYGRASSTPVATRNSKLTQLKIELELAGSYSGIRAFVHSLETAPEFVVIDNMQLSETGDDDDVQLELALSTYYKGAQP
jgi:Tfp pilus assembly protein PilO